MKLVSLVGKVFGRLTVLERTPENKYVCICACGKTATVLRSNLTQGNTTSCGCSRSASKRGDKNPAWVGDAVGYQGVHGWFRRLQPPPLNCPQCGSSKRIEACNISGEYRRDPADWEYLCRKCHMAKDGRNVQLVRSARSRKLPEPICLYCGKQFYRRSGLRKAKFCSRSCLSKAGGPKGYTK